MKKAGPELTEVSPISKLRNISHMLDRIRARELDAFRVTPRQMGIMRAVVELGDDATPANIARALSRRPTSISNILRRMEEIGLVSRVPNPHRAKSFHVSLTAQGQAVFTTATSSPAFREVHAMLSAASQRELPAIITDLHRAVLEKYRTTTGPKKSCPP